MQYMGLQEVQRAIPKDEGGVIIAKLDTSREHEDSVRLDPREHDHHPV